MEQREMIKKLNQLNFLIIKLKILPLVLVTQFQFQIKTKFLLGDLKILFHNQMINILIIIIQFHLRYLVFNKMKTKPSILTFFLN
jgi:hypothetical protein